MPKRTTRRGSGHIIRLSRLIREGAAVELVFKTIAGINCKQYTVGKQYRLIINTQNNGRAQLFMGDFGRGWINTGLPTTTCAFLSKLLKRLNLRSTQYEARQVS